MSTNFTIPERDGNASEQGRRSPSLCQNPQLLLDPAPGAALTPSGDCRVKRTQLWALLHKHILSGYQNDSQRCDLGTVTMSLFLPCPRGGAPGQGRSFAAAAWSDRKRLGRSASIPKDHAELSLW